MEELPMVVPPHPLYDLSPDSLRELAHSTYPLIIEHLTAQHSFLRIARVNFDRGDKDTMARAT